MNLDKNAIYERLIQDLLTQLDDRKLKLYLRLRIIQTISTLMKDSEVTQKNNPELVIEVENIISESRLIDYKRLSLKCNLPDDELSNILDTLRSRGRLSETQTSERTVYSITQ